MMTTSNTSAIQKLLRNEITWIVFIIGIFWGVVSSIVLPLQRLQIQISQVQTQISQQSVTNDTLTKIVNDLSNRTSVIESRLNNIDGKTIKSQ